MDLDALNREVSAFVTQLDELHGYFLDSTQGFRANHKFMVEAQVQSANVVAPGTDLDALSLFYGRGDPNDPGNIIQYTTTQGQFKQRNEQGGRNHVLSGQLFVVLVYAFWETGYRAQISAALGLADTGSLKLPLLGDLRLLRRDIIHHRGIVTDETASKLQVLTQFSPGREIVLTDQEVETLVRNLKATLDSLVVDAGGIDPKHRTLWHVR